MATIVEQEGKWPLWFGREATRTWRKSTTSKDFFDNFGREFSLPTNWFGKLETSWIHFCKKIAATYKLLKSPTFRPIFQIGPRTNSLPSAQHREGKSWPQACRAATAEALFSALATGPRTLLCNNTLPNTRARYFPASSISVGSDFKIHAYT